MAWFSRLFASKPSLPPAQQARLDAWRGRPRPDLSRPLADSRCVVVDVETSGLDLARDRLIAIGAVAVRQGRIVVGDSFEAVLRQPRSSSHENILVHGITGTAQTEGIPPADALLAFLDYLDGDPLVAFHVAFDETMIRRACAEHLGLDFRHPWSDLAYLAPALHPKLAGKRRYLDDWTTEFGIPNFARHSATADALCTAELLLVLLPHAARQKATRFADLRDLEKAQRWVGWAN